MPDDEPRLYPFAPLAAIAGLTPSEAARRLGISGSTWKQYRDHGMTERVADRRAVQLGYHPHEVWPDMLEDAVAVLDGQEAERAERRRQQRNAQNRRAYWRNPEKHRERSRTYRQESADYNRQRMRLWYQRNAEEERRKRRERYQAGKRDVKDAA